MNEGIFTASASKQRKIFSQVTKAKKEIFKNASETKPAVKEENQMPSFQQLRTSLEEKTLTPAEKTKREEIAKAMERETPGMPMAKKMAIATAQAKKVTEAKDSREYDYEGDMSKSQLRSIIANAQTVHDMLEDNTNMAEWVQSKITLAADYISTVADYMQSEVNEADTVKEDIHEVTDNDMAHSAHMHGLKHGREGAGDNMDRAKAQYGTHFKHYNAGFLKGRNEKAKSLKAFGQGYGKVKEDIFHEAVSVKKEKHSWGTMMTVHHGSDTSYPLHPEHQQAIAKLGDGEKTSFKDETNTHVVARRDGDNLHLTQPKKSSTMTTVAHSHFNTPSEHAKPAAKKPAGEYDRKVTSYLKKKYNEEVVLEAENPCWDGYKMLGMKDKGGKKVPNCIPEESHYCAKHVYSNMFGEGTVVEGIHADPDEQGNVEWYAVQFNEGIKKVFTENLEIMIAEYHGNHKKKKRMTNG